MWGNGEPDEIGAGNQNCGAFIEKGDIYDSGIADESCSASFPVVCQFEVEARTLDS